MNIQPLLFSGDTAYSLGTAMDELMRHQPMLKPDAMKAIVKVRGRNQEKFQKPVFIFDPKITCFRRNQENSRNLCSLDPAISTCFRRNKKNF